MSWADIVLYHFVKELPSQDALKDAPKVRITRDGAITPCRIASIVLAAQDDSDGEGHRIKDDRRENSIKGIRIWHCAFAASIILCSTPT